MLITKKIIVKVDILSRVTYSNLCSIIWSKVRDVALAMDNVMGCILVVEGDGGSKGSCEVIVDDSAAITVVDRVDVDVSYLVVTSLEEVGFSESLTKHFYFLATGETG